MNTKDFAAVVFERWKKADSYTQKSVVRYMLRHCCYSVLADVWCYILEIE